MGNHFHIILRNRPDIVATWSDKEVARRIWNLFPKRRQKDGQPAVPTKTELDALAGGPEKIQEYRLPLSDVSWIMKQLAKKRRSLFGNSYEAGFNTCGAVGDNGSSPTIRIGQLKSDRLQPCTEQNVAIAFQPSTPFANASGYLNLLKRPLPRVAKKMISRQAPLTRNELDAFASDSDELQENR